MVGSFQRLHVRFSQNRGVVPADIRGDVLSEAIFDAKFEGITRPVGFTKAAERLPSFDIKSFQPNASLGHVDLKTVRKMTAPQLT